MGVKKYLSRNDESRGVGTEVEEELCEDVEGEKPVSSQRVVGEADGDEDCSEDDETDDLDGLATDGVDGGNGDPVAGDGAGTSYDEVANGLVEEDLVDVFTVSVADLGEDDGVV